MNDMGIGGALFIGLLYIVGCFIVFLIVRQGVLWYFRINEAISLLTKIEVNTRRESAGNVAMTPGSGSKKVSVEAYTDINQENELVQEISTIRVSKDKSKMPFLIDCLHHKSPRVRWEAVDAVGEFKDVGAIPALKLMLSEPNTRAHQHIQEVIDKINENSRSQI